MNTDETEKMNESTTKTVFEHKTHKGRQELRRKILRFCCRYLNLNCVWYAFQGERTFLQ